MQARTKFVVFLLVVLEFCAWFMSLANNLMAHYWDKRYALHYLASQPLPDAFHNATAVDTIATSYYSPRRYVWFLPHVFGAIIWWNLYFLQLIPSVRKSYQKRFHRWLGRLLMVAVLSQTISGVGLACTSHSSIIKIVSLTLSVVVMYCWGNAWYYAWKRDIPRHKYWVLRLVGYLQSIAAQRFWSTTLFVAHACGNTFLYPAFGDDEKMNNQIVYDMFDGSFVLAVLSATSITEWYLSGMVDTLVEPPVTPAIQDGEAPLAGRKNAERSPLQRDRTHKYQAITIEYT